MRRRAGKMWDSIKNYGVKPLNFHFHCVYICKERKEKKLMMKKEDNDVHAVTLQHQALPTELLTCLVILIGYWQCEIDFKLVTTYNAKVQQKINSDKPAHLYNNNLYYILVMRCNIIWGKLNPSGSSRKETHWPPRRWTAMVRVVRRWQKKEKPYWGNKKRIYKALTMIDA